MNKLIRILEIPIYLLVISIAVWEIEENISVSIFLVVVSMLDSLQILLQMNLCTKRS